MEERRCDYTAISVPSPDRKDSSTLPIIKDKYMTVKKEKAPDEEVNHLLTNKALQNMIDAAVKKERAKIRKESKNNPKLGGIQSYQIDYYLDKTSLTDRKFVEMLINSHVKAEYASVLRDEHKNLDINRIWKIIRDNYRPIKI